jgi:hypothetical protein
VKQTVARVLDVEGKKRRACFQDSHHRDDHLGRPVHADADAIARHHSPIDELAAECIGTAIELAVCEVAVRPRDSDGGRCASGLIDQEAVNSTARRVSPYGTDESRQWIEAYQLLWLDVKVSGKGSTITVFFPPSQMFLRLPASRSDLG